MIRHLDHLVLVSINPADMPAWRQVVQAAIAFVLGWLSRHLTGKKQP